MDILSLADVKEKGFIKSRGKAKSKFNWKNFWRFARA